MKQNFQEQGSLRSPGDRFIIPGNQDPVWDPWFADTILQMTITEYVGVSGPMLGTISLKRREA